MPDAATGRTEEARRVALALLADFPDADAYRFNPASIRVRVVSPKFAGKSLARRVDMIEPALHTLPEETQADIIACYLFTPDELAGEPTQQLLNREFERDRRGAGTPDAGRLLVLYDKVRAVLSQVFPATDQCPPGGSKPRDDDHCWLDAYVELAGLVDMPDWAARVRLLPPQIMKSNCDRFVDSLCAGAGYRPDVALLREAYLQALSRLTDGGREAEAIAFTHRRRALASAPARRAAASPDRVVPVVCPACGGSVRHDNMDCCTSCGWDAWV